MSTIAPDPVSKRSKPNLSSRQDTGRMLSLDVFRGLIVAGMVLVTNAGSWDHVYWPLKHADWNGVTPTDMIFPSFLFICGVSMTLSFKARLARGVTVTELVGKVILRSICLIVLGLFLNGFPLYDLHNLRIPGVLQRIGLCYLGAGLFYLIVAQRRKQFGSRALAITGAIVVLLAGYWALLRFAPVPGYGVGRLDQAGNLGAFIDRIVFGTNHLWFYGGQMWDPEGLLSTLTASANLLLGILTGEWLGRENSESGKLLGVAAAGMVLLSAGLLSNSVIPINKKIWTDSFVLFSGGFSLLTLALLSWAIDRRGWRLGISPALIFGSNAILGFALANMLNPLESLLHFQIDGKDRTIRSLVFQGLSSVMSPYNGSLGYALCFVMLNLAILWMFYRKRIFLRL
jgi:predicted acyltransferase